MNHNFLLYKYRFFFGYVIIGIFSLLIELILFKTLNGFFKNQFLNSFISVILGILFSFWINVRYNFKISKIKRNRALLYFLIISLTSYVVQFFLINKFENYFSYEILRLIFSGSFFWIAYLIHRNFSFKDYKQVGVAIYANGVENIKYIFDRIENYPDFIHVDIVDETINEDAEQTLSFKSEVIRGYWNSKFIEIHIMSKTPKKWILETIDHVDCIFIHCDINENIEEILSFIKSKKVKPGIVIQEFKHIDIFEKHHDIIDNILILCIEKPGFSGQKFKMESLKLIEEINKNKYRDQITLTIDGGINNENISLIKSEKVVSGSYVLNDKDPIKNIMILQTSSQYESS